MIPLRLTLHNFMCYRTNQPPLELEGVHLACLSGDNGAGKSALLDAVTWVLWGKARVSSDLDLMTVGATEMRVEYEFRLGEQDFRVVRQRTRKGAGRIWLNLYVRDQEDDAWRSLSGDGVYQTQAIINGLVRMEYETFINSAFILQGRADEFTTKKPAERKAVLGEILGLSVYDEMEKKARERRKEQIDALRELEAERGRLAAILAREPELLTQLDGLSAELIAQDEAIERLTNEHRGVCDRLTSLQGLEQRRLALRAVCAADEEQRREEAARAAASEREIARHEALLARREEIEAKHAELVRAKERRTELDGLVQRLRGLESRRGELRQAVGRAHSHLEAEQRALQKHLLDLNEQARTLPGLEAQRAEKATMAATLAHLEAEITLRQEVERSAHGEAEALKAANGHLMEQMRRLKERQTQVDGADASCPLCRRPLGLDDKVHIHAGYQDEGRELRATYDANKQRLSALQADSARLRIETTELGLRLKAAQLAAKEEARLGEQIARAKAAAAEQAVAQLRLVELAGRLAAGQYAAAEQATLAEVEAEIAALGYDEAAHAAAQAAVQSLERYADERAALRLAEGQLPRERAALAAATAAAERLAARLAETAAEMATLTAAVAGLPALRQEEIALQAAVAAGRRERDACQQQLGRVQEGLAACAEARAALVAGEVAVTRRLEERELYGELVEAFGKKGIQAMVIEQAVPEIQDEANGLLDRMPGNTMRVEFQTQRDSQKGDTIETLDVIIKDEAGARKYELYSGGEAFRANFAIRVALSKLLARRAGARLQLLVIDEGFGTQDARGREGLIEAIKSIENDFATILVITHLAEIRDQFPVQIAVTKEVEGSLVTMR